MPTKPFGQYGDLIGAYGRPKGRPNGTTTGTTATATQYDPYANQNIGTGIGTPMYGDRQMPGGFFSGDPARTQPNIAPSLGGTPPPGVANIQPTGPPQTIGPGQTTTYDPSNPLTTTTYDPSNPLTTKTFTPPPMPDISGLHPNIDQGMVANMWGNLYNPESGWEPKMRAYNQDSGWYNVTGTDESYETNPLAHAQEQFKWSPEQIQEVWKALEWGDPGGAEPPPGNLGDDVRHTEVPGPYNPPAGGPPPTEVVEPGGGYGIPPGYGGDTVVNQVPQPPGGSIQPVAPPRQLPPVQQPNVNINRPNIGDYGGGDFGEGSFYQSLRNPLTADIGLSDQERQSIYNLGRGQIQGSTKAMMDEARNAFGGRGFRAGESGVTDTALGGIAQQGQQALGEYSTNISIAEARDRFGQNMALNQANLNRNLGGAGIDLARDTTATQRYGIDTDVASRQAELNLQKYGVDVGARGAEQGLGLQKYGIDVGARTAGQGFGTQRYGIDVGADTSRYGIDVGADVSKYLGGLSAETSRYGTDVGAETSRYGADVGAGASRYGTDVRAGVDTERIRSQANVAQQNMNLSDAQFQQQFGFSKQQFQYQQQMDAINAWFSYYGQQQQQQQQEWNPWWQSLIGTGLS